LPFKCNLQRYISDGVYAPLEAFLLGKGGGGRTSNTEAYTKLDGDSPVILSLLRTVHA
jgi:hypothetical protein